MKLIDYFDKYVELGLKPIAIYPNQKCPMSNEWNINWSVKRWRPYFYTNDCNIGILLGDIVDVEGDSEEANDLIERMIDGQPRPRFRSAKSIHNLFINPDPTLTRFVCNGIEFRGNKHQSVMPPSSHENGNKYNWICGSEFPIPQMPEELKRFYFENKNAKKKRVWTPPPKPKIKKGYVKTTCNKCKNSFHLNKARLLLEVQAFRIHGSLWMCRNCKVVDVRDTCREIRKQFQKSNF